MDDFQFRTNKKYPFASEIKLTTLKAGAENGTWIGLKKHPMKQRKLLSCSKRQYLKLLSRSQTFAHKIIINQTIAFFLLAFAKSFFEDKTINMDIFSYIISMR
jgi:hypothetical protein